MLVFNIPYIIFPVLITIVTIIFGLYLFLSNDHYRIIITYYYIRLPVILTTLAWLIYFCFKEV